MKKVVKYILIGAVTIIAVAGGLYYMNMPIAVNIISVVPKVAELYFIEKGIASAQQQIEVYAPLAGEITMLNTKKGQIVNKGDIICKLDDSEYQYQIRQIESSISGYKAQINSLSAEEARQNDQLKMNRNRLTQELNVLNAQENGIALSKDEQIRLQNIIIEQYENDVNRAYENVEKLERLQDIIQTQNRNDLEKAKENVEKIEQLNSITINQNKSELETAMENLDRYEKSYNAGLISAVEYDNAKNAVKNAQALLDRTTVVAQQEYDNAVKAVSDIETLLSKNKTMNEQEYNDALSAIQRTENTLKQSRQQLSLIEKGNGSDSNAYFYALRQSLAEQIKDIDDSLNKSYTQDMAEYYSSLIEGNNIDIERLNKKIEDTSIKSPVHGKITELYVENTNFASQQIPIALITCDKDSVIDVYVTVMDIGTVDVKDEVLITLKGRFEDKEITGIVTQIDNSAVAKTSVLGIEERRVKVTVTPDDPEIFIDGYDVDVKFSIFHEEGKLTVPKTSLFKVGDRDMLWVVREGKVVMTEVIKGLELRTEFVISDGLNPGDMIIVDADTPGVKEGINVKGEDVKF